ncbi:uncharacterized protein EV420DRAFT_1019371 [Desarmillaria tabescens]|uniref:Uncharacterized protein n=1 Tax=Armillaria tabescens TaxID=1929756 RepID=A0AA39JL87_ARMTA|nr:uncharacterized protein EV420DRAFT_1019371 [Desarmillaria tabescens]KAK0444000.1 hypothetical protein EV420DRAFT_1019371 [Desarmillaria tabescens]
MLASLIRFPQFSGRLRSFCPQFAVSHQITLAQSISTATIQKQYSPSNRSFGVSDLYLHYAVHVDAPRSYALLSAPQNQTPISRVPVSCLREHAGRAGVNELLSSFPSSSELMSQTICRLRRQGVSRVLDIASRRQDLNIYERLLLDSLRDDRRGRMELELSLVSAVVDKFRTEDWGKCRRIVSCLSLTRRFR